MFRTLIAVMLLLFSPLQATGSDNPWLDLALEQAEQDAGPGLISGVIDYIALRQAIAVTPDLLRARIKACGSCKERTSLERSLALAERDQAVVGAIESAMGRALNMDPWEARKLGIRIRSDAELKLAPACLALRDQAADCATALNDRNAGDSPGMPCYTKRRLATLCAEGDAKSFYDYVDFSRRRERGEVVFEPWENNQGSIRQFYYHNVPSDMKFPAAVVENDRNAYSYVNDRAQVGVLKRAGVTGMSPVGPDLPLAWASQFREPWSTIIRHDNVEVHETARLLVCSYVDAKPGYVTSYSFWYRQRPASADPAYLSGRMANHPLLRVGPAHETCPMTVQAANAANPSIPWETLNQRYAGKLK